MRDEVVPGVRAAGRPDAPVRTHRDEVKGMLLSSSGRWLSCLLFLAHATVWLQAQSTESPLDRQLVAAVGKGDTAAVTDLLDKGANVNATNRYGTSPLFIAAD